MTLRTFMKSIAGRTPLLGRVLADRESLRKQLGKLAHPPGHFYSPIPDELQIDRHLKRLGDRKHVELPGIELNPEKQLDWTRRIAGFYSDQPFSEKQTESLRFYFDNNMFRESDALFLYGMLREIKPNRIVEVGSGFSSAVMLDTRETFLEVNPELTFIEPHPERLRRLLRDGDHERSTVIEQPIQYVESAPWQSLESGDILFIDSSHVSKCGSDVNFLFTEVIPRLEEGVFVHVHDISYPFEYPDSWLTQRRWAWNEAYILHTFLQFNHSFEIVAWVSYLNHMHCEWLHQCMPLCKRDPGGSIWLRRTEERGGR